MKDDSFRILVVCTANICRSVMAEQMLRHAAATRGLDVEISSCGMLFEGESASETVLEVLADRGLDASDHRSRVFRPELAHDADLVVTMERVQARELALMTNGASGRIHTLGAISGWFAALEQNDLGGSPKDRVASFGATRESSDLLGFGSEEVADPHGRSRRIHRRTADRLAGLTTDLLNGLFGPA